MCTRVSEEKEFDYDQKGKNTHIRCGGVKRGGDYWGVGRGGKWLYEVRWRCSTICSRLCYRNFSGRGWMRKGGGEKNTL